MSNRVFGLPKDWSPLHGPWPEEFMFERNPGHFFPNREWWRDMYLKNPTIPGSFFFYRPAFDKHITFPLNMTSSWCCYLVSLPLGKTWTPIAWSGYDKGHGRPLKAWCYVLIGNTKVVAEFPQADVLAKSVHGRDAHVFIEWSNQGLVYTWTHANRHDEEFAYLTSYHEMRDKWKKFLEWEWKRYWLKTHTSLDGYLAF